MEQRARWRACSIRKARTLLYPLFTADLLHLMRTLIPAERQGELAAAVVVSARLPC
jgi:hypothetical protein